MAKGSNKRQAQRTRARKLVRESADLLARAKETVADARNTCHTVSLQRTLDRMLAERKRKPPR